MTIDSRPVDDVQPPLRKVRTTALDLVVANPTLAASLLCSWAADHQKVGRHVHLINAYTLARMEQDPALQSVLRSDAINFADGRPLATVVRLLQRQSQFRQVRGPGLFHDTFDTGRRYGLRHFLLGSTPEVLELLQIKLEARFPGAIIAGTFSPPFRDLDEGEEREQDRLIAATAPDIVWIGLGTPKQDFEARRLARSLQTLCVGIGAAFDFTAGTRAEAPAWVRTAGFEWLFRLMTEPERLWKRYLFGNFAFVRSVLAGAYRDPTAR